MQIITVAIMIGTAMTYKVPIVKKTLENGLEVVVSEDHSNPLVSVQVWYRVGARNEHEGITGISHLLEHMMFKGTEKYGPEEYSQIIQRMGGTDNAFTAEDMTAYFSEVPSSQLEKVLELEADRMQNVVFREFEEEKKVVMEERRWRTENSPWGLFFEEMGATALVAHPYRNPVIGWMSDINNITLNDIKDYYETYYSPKNAILIIAGDVNPENAFKLAEKYFGHIKNKQNKIPEVRTREPEQRGERRFVIKLEGFTTIWGVAYHSPEFTHPDYPALVILNQILTSGRSSRLYRKLVAESGLATNVWGWVERSVDPYLFNIVVSVQPGKSVDSVEKVVFEEIEKLKTENPPTDQEMEKSINNAIAGFIYQQQSEIGKGVMLGSFAILDKPDAINEFVPRLQKVTKDDVVRVAKIYLSEDKRTVGILKPIPPKDIQAYMEKVKEAQSKEFRR